MKAFDTDVLTLVFQGQAACVQKTAQIPPAERCVPVVAVEQLLRGRLNAIRKAEAGKAKGSIDQAYHFLEKTLSDLKAVQVLSFTPAAESLVQSWRKQKIRVGVSDMRIAAVCIVHGATLISRNRHDFDQIPNLSVEYW